ncbi:MAG: DUF1211 domain-containing protein [Bdellovibrionales bacterium]|nr:DUF1211 domain-containing protein [Bdellovibrionales bacterium]
MHKGRLEAFSDGVLAIILTIMVLELKVPHGETIEALRPLVPVFLSYVLSFVYIAIYWNNHHHLFQDARRVNGPVLWANLHLLFWLSLLPFATAWVGENHFQSGPLALYGVVLLMSGIAYFILTQALLRQHDKDSVLAHAIGRDLKGKLSVVAYVVAVPLAFFVPWLAAAIYIGVALVWTIPDRRIEKSLDVDRS